MSLQVWLPLTKDTRQQGLSNISVTGSPASWGNGKLGKCATWNGAVANIIYNNTTDFNYTNNFSVAFWANPVYTGSTAQYAWTVGRADAGGYGYGFQIVNATTAYFRFGNGSYSVSAPSNEWHHFAMTIGNSKVTIYKDGVQVSSNNLPGTIPTYSDGNGMGLGCFHYSGNIYPYYGSLNDFRIYDHCLSPMEVKELSKGLVLHYPLNRQGWGQDNIIPGTNLGTANWYWTMQAGNYTAAEETTLSGVRGCKFTRGTTAQSGWSVIYYNNINESLFKTSTAYKLSVDIYPSVNTNFVVSIRESNGTNVFANATPAKAVVANKWNHLEFDLTTVATLPSSTGETIYFQSMDSSTGVSYIFRNLKLEEGSIATPWCPNSSDALATTMGLNSTTEYDCSGFCNNGTRTGTFTWTSDTPKYAVSTKLTTGSKITSSTGMITTANPTFTCNFWVKMPSATYTTWADIITFSGSAIIRMETSNTAGTSLSWYNYPIGTSSGIGTNGIVNNTDWNMFTLTCDGTNWKTYKNGVLANTTAISGTAWTPNGTVSIGDNGMYAQLSDVRIYATALSADDVKSLYQNCATIDPDGTIRGQIRS